MNGRMYDAKLGRFLSPDNYVQEPYSTQSFNRYGYVWNNPLRYTDPSGEFIIRALIGALISVITNGITNLIEGRPFFQGAGLAALTGAIGGAFSFGIGEAVSELKGIVKIGVQLIAHGHLGGMMSAAMGGDYFSGFASGAIGSLAGSGTGGLLKNVKSSFWRAAGTIASSSLSGGVGSVISGGKFWDGFRNGAISSSLNHVVHMIRQVNPEKLKKRILKDGKLTLKEANKWYRHGRGEPLTVDASKIDLDFVNPDDYPLKIERGANTLLRSRDGLVYGKINITRLKDNIFSIGPDKYDFNMEAGISFRNFATKIASWIAGEGTPYWINFKGVNTVNYRPFTPNYNNYHMQPKF